MNLQEIQNAIGRTRMVAEMDKNQVRKHAKLSILQLIETDLIATYKHLQ
jgi:hypothetical protein